MIITREKLTGLTWWWPSRCRGRGTPPRAPCVPASPWGRPSRCPPRAAGAGTRARAGRGSLAVWAPCRGNLGRYGECVLIEILLNCSCSLFSPSLVLFLDILLFQFTWGRAEAVGGSEAGEVSGEGARVEGWSMGRPTVETSEVGPRQQRRGVARHRVAGRRTHDILSPKIVSKQYFLSPLTNIFFCVLCSFNIFHSEIFALDENIFVNHK